MRTQGAMPNSFDMANVGELEPRLQSIIRRRGDLLGPGYKLFYDRPLEIVRGEGVYLYDADGNQFLDAYNNVPCVGHCNPRVADAIDRQVRMLNTNTRYAAEPILDYAERLLDTHAPGLGRVMFTCTGSEAIDLALRIARYVTKGTGVVVTSNAYHGITTAAAEISPNLGSNVPLGQHVQTVPAPTPDMADGAATRLAEGVERAIADLARHGIKFAAFVADSVFASDGLVTEPAGFLNPIPDLVHEAGGLYIADEVQAGFGRTGDAMWGYQRHQIVPDLAAMGKPMGNGMPIGGVVARPELLEQFGKDVRYFNTFGGNSVSIAAANAVLDVINEDRLLENARIVGTQLREGLARIAELDPRVQSVRGAGLFLAADFAVPETGAPDPETTRQVVNGLRERRVLISAAGPSAAALKIRPPLPFGEADAKCLLSGLESVLARTGKSAPVQHRMANGAGTT
jgi:4-aminobutyrate aminotransferase-like enzyme